MTDISNDKPLAIAIVVGSTRPGRHSAEVATWVAKAAADRHDATFTVVDLADHPLPHLDEPMPAIFGDYQHAHTRDWAAVVDGYDAFVIVTPEYNHSIPGVLKNAIDHLFAEWNDKAVGVVAHGAEGGHRAVEHLRQIAGELKMAVVRQQVTLSAYTDFEDYVRFTPRPQASEQLETLLDQVVSWGRALRQVRLEAVPRG